MEEEKQMEKEKMRRRAWLGLRKKKKDKESSGVKRRRAGSGGWVGKNGSFVKSVVDYLLSDSYMYAPIADSIPAALAASSPATAATATQKGNEKPVSVVQLRKLLADECVPPTSPLYR